jgi:hypothetical protein
MVSLQPRQRVWELLREVIWSRIKLVIKATALNLMHIVRNRNYEVHPVNISVTQRFRFSNIRIQTEYKKTCFTKAKTSTNTFNEKSVTFQFFLRCYQIEVLLRHYNGICNKHTMFGIRVKVEGISSAGEM